MRYIFPTTIGPDQRCTITQAFTRGGTLKPDTVRRILVRDVVTPLLNRFPREKYEQGFKDGRLHSFRHYFASMCAINGVPERVAMDWLGHQDFAMVRHYFHLNDLESRRQMDRLNPLGASDERLAGNVNRAGESKEEEKPTRKNPTAATRPERLIDTMIATVDCANQSLCRKCLNNNHLQ
jgi:hypothetical protein